MSRSDAFDKLERLREAGVSDTAIVDYLINCYTSGDEAVQFMESCEEEFDLEDNDND